MSSIIIPRIIRVFQGNSYLIYVLSAGDTLLLAIKRIFKIRSSKKKHDMREGVRLDVRTLGNFSSELCARAVYGVRMTRSPWKVLSRRGDVSQDVLIDVYEVKMGS